jgi:small subunit ribosomal protein S20
MANTKQAAKRAKTSVKQRAANQSMRTTLRSAIKKIQKAIASGDAKAAEATFRSEQSTIDHIADKRDTRAAWLCRSRRSERRARRRNSPRATAA